MKTFDFEPTHEAAARVRRQLRQLFDTTGLPPQVSADLELIVAELTSNAVEQRPDEPVRLEVAIQDGLVQVTVVNAGAGFDLPSTSTSSFGPGGDLLADRGRGLRIVEALSDSLWVDQSDGWTSVTCIRRFDPTPD